MLRASALFVLCHQANQINKSSLLCVYVCVCASFEFIKNPF